MSTRRKSTLFLVELLIAIAVFALCAAICINILAASYSMTVSSNETANALIAAQNFAEEFKAIDGSGNLTAGGPGSFQITGNNAAFISRVYYDEAWRPVGGPDGAGYVLVLDGMIFGYGGGLNLYSGDIKAYRINGEEILTLPVAATKR